MLTFQLGGCKLASGPFACRSDQPEVPMRFVSAAVLTVVTCLSGCTTNRPLPDATRAGSLIDYVQALRRETSTLLDTVVVSTTTPTQDLPEYRAWGDHWCPRHQEVH